MPPPPPCTGCGHWGHPNRHSNPGMLRKCRNAGECLAASAARVGNIQFREDRHLIAENPAGPESFHLECFEAMWNSSRVVKINVSQSASCLVADGQPIYTNIIPLAGSTLPIEFLGDCSVFGHRAVHSRVVVGMSRRQDSPTYCRGRCATGFAQAFNH